MAWTITAPGAEVTVSYGSMSRVADELADVLTGSQWRSLRSVFGPRSGDPFTVPASEAGRVADLLHQAVRTCRMSSPAAGLALTLADSARAAAAAGRPWSWA